jgi:hypothetical protein
LKVRHRSHAVQIPRRPPGGVGTLRPTTTARGKPH